jgi:OHCU decarboxylase
MPFTLARINRMTRTQFVETFGGVFEQSPWVAEHAADARPFASFDALCECMKTVVEESSAENKERLLRAHPDLGTRARISASSASEQAGAGLDSLSPCEHQELIRLNERFKTKFGFPFIFAVRGSDKAAVLATLTRRLESSREGEFEEALKQVYRIARFRLEDLVTR